MISVSVPTFGSAGVCVCIIFFAMYFLLLRVRRTRTKVGDRLEEEEEPYFIVFTKFGESGKKGSAKR